MSLPVNGISSLEKAAARSQCRTGMGWVQKYFKKMHQCHLEASAKQQWDLIFLADMHLTTKNQVQTALSRGAKISATVKVELTSVTAGMLVPKDRPLECDSTGMLTLAQSILCPPGELSFSTKRAETGAWHKF